MLFHTNLRLKGKKGPPARGAAPKGLGGVEPEKQPLRFADANHLPFQGRQSILNAIWYQNVFRIRTYTHSIQYLRWMFTQLVNNHQIFKRYDIFRWCQARKGLYAIDWQILMNCSMMGFESE